MLTIMIPDADVDTRAEFAEMLAWTLANPYEVDGEVYLKDGKPLYPDGSGGLYADPREATRRAHETVAITRGLWAEFARDCERMGY